MDTNPLEAPEIALLADEDCPNAAPTRALLREVLAELGLPVEFVERRCGDPSLPPELRGLGSPTILVDGRDALGERGEAQASSCRIYRDASGRPSGLPSRRALRGALLAAMERRRKRSGGARLAAIGLALAFALLGAPGGAEAQVLHYWVQVEGLSCPFCMAGLKKSFAKLEAVRRLRADFEKRRLDFDVAEGALLRPERVRAAVEDGGFTPGPLSARLRGTLQQQDGSLVLQVPGGQRPWTLPLRGEGPLRTLRRWLDEGKRAVRLVGRLRRAGDRWVLHVERLAHEPWRERRQPDG